MIDSNTIKVLRQKIEKSQELKLNHIYDMGDNWLVSVRTDDNIDLMDPYYMADKSTLKISNFKLQEKLPEFKIALTHKVY